MLKSNSNSKPAMADETITKKTWLQTYKKPVYGFLFAMISSILNVAANLLVKKTSFFNEFDNGSIRYFVQFFVLFIIALISKQSICGDRVNLKLLIFRGSISGIGLLSLYASIKLIHPSDALSLFSCNVIFVAILSRIFMKEKFTVLHIVALVFIVCGIISITKPSFLIPRDTVNELGYDLINRTNNLSLLESVKTNSKSESTNESISLLAAMGYFLGIFAGFVYASAAILIKQLSSRKIHYSTINLFAVYFGLPMSLLTSLIAIKTGYYHKDIYNEIKEVNFIAECFYAVISAITGVFSQVFWIQSLKFEDATKIGMYRTSDLILTFLFQYFFLGIASDIYSILGGFFITIGMLIVIAYKIIDKKEQDRLKNMTELKLMNTYDDEKLEKHEYKENCCRKFIFFQF